MVEFHQQVQEISWVQESVSPTPTQMPTPTPTPKVFALKPTCPPQLWWGDINTSNGFMLQSRHEYVVEMAIFNVQRAITPKVCNPELQFLRSARLLMVLNICVKFHENILNVFEVTEYVVKIAIFQCSKGNNSKRMQSRVTAPALCTLSHPPIHLYEVS